MAIPVARYKRNSIVGDESSPELFYLKPEPGHSRVLTLGEAASEIEVTGALSAQDVDHAAKALTRCIKSILTRGDKLKIEGLGTFYITFNSTGTEEEKDCTVRNIRRVNVRFAVDNTLRLVNDSTATTRSAPNNVKFYIKGESTSATGSDDNSGGGSGSGGGDEFIDPSA